MAPRSSHDVPRNQRGQFSTQRPDGSVVISVPSASNFVISAASLASTGMGRLLAEGLRHNEHLYWTTRAGFEGPELDQVYCDRIDNPPRSPGSHNSSHRADHGDSNAHHLSPYDEPHPSGLHRRGDIESTRRQSLGDSPLHQSLYQERARRGSVTNEQPPLYYDLRFSPTTQSSDDSLPPPYSIGENPPPYPSTNSRRDEMDFVVLARPRSGNDYIRQRREGLSFSERIR